MNLRTVHKLHVWMLGFAAPGLLWQSLPAFGQTADPEFTNAVKPKFNRYRYVGQLHRGERSPSTSRASDAMIQLVAATDDGKSEVQRQLEALYEKDGREMPDMNFDLQPLSPINNGQQQQQPSNPQQPSSSGIRPDTPAPTQYPPANQRPTQGYKQYQPQPQQRTQAVPYPSQPATQPGMNGSTAVSPGQPGQTQQRPGGVAGFFKRLGGVNRSQTASTSQAPVPPDYSHTQPTVPQTYPQSNQTMPSPVRPPINAPMAQAYQAPVRPAPQQANFAAQLGLSNQPNRAVNQTKMSTPAEAPATVSFQKPIVNTPVAAAPMVPVLPPPTVQLPSLDATASPIAAGAPVNLPAATAPVAELSSLPELSTNPVKIIGESPKAEKTQPKEEALAENQPVKVEATPVKVASRPIEKPRTTDGKTGGDFPNPFPELAESEVDIKIQPARPRDSQPPAETKVVVAPKNEATPPKALVPEESKALIAEEAEEKPAKLEDDPYAVEAKDFVEPLVRDLNEQTPDPSAPSLEAIPAAPPSSSDDGAPDLISPPEDELKEEAKDGVEPGKIEQPETTQVLNTPTDTKQEESATDKLKRLHERTGMKGLKGFCPVALRESRELIDALPEFSCTYRKQKYHFSSAEARDKFELNPARFAPAAYGADVVALRRDKDVLQGTLDYAAWYKGRLYMFSSQANYDMFIAEPTKYATLDGIE